jgi:imidazoleglycerol-phosphate dehydratase
MREAETRRTTSETDITARIALDGTAMHAIDTGIGFLDHMLVQLARHGLFDITLAAKGDRHIDDHHTAEDSGIVLGTLFAEAVGDKRGITRFAHALCPLDEALAEVVVDISGRPYLAWNVAFPTSRIGTFDTELVGEWFRAFAMNARITLHVTLKAGTNSHHIAEACFKALARALRAAVAIDPRAARAVPSSKGTLA